MVEKVPKTPAVSVRFDPDQLELLDRLAEKERLDRSALVRRLVDEALTFRDRQPPGMPPKIESMADIVQAVGARLAAHDELIAGLDARLSALERKG